MSRFEDAVVYAGGAGLFIGAVLLAAPADEQPLFGILGAALVLAAVAGCAWYFVARRHRAAQSLERIRREHRERVQRESGLAEGGALSGVATEVDDGKLTLGRSERRERR